MSLNFDNIFLKKNIRRYSVNRLFAYMLSYITVFSLIRSNLNLDKSSIEDKIIACYYIGPDCSTGRFGRYVASNENFLFNLKRTEQYKLITLEEKELLDFINKNDLFSIEENRDVISNIVSCNKEGMEYEYVLYTEKMTELLSDGRFVERTIAHCSWTRVPEEGNYLLTGRTRMICYIYYGYKIEKDSNGIYRLLESAPVRCLQDLPEGYNYVKERFSKVVIEENMDYTSGVQEQLIEGDEKPKQKVIKMGDI